ncbi:MAG: hypothetical protein NC402_00460 [Prevotella sp.]|nr:hypothetical protein [Prevotella sp.]MCM1074757.1 hypothetical protein [Ruminococcus sp.]
MTNKTLTLKVPIREVYRINYYNLCYHDKEFFRKRLNFLSKMVRKEDLVIKITGENKSDVDFMSSSVKDFNKNGTSAIKEDLIRFFICVFHCKENVFAIADMRADAQALELARTLVDKGALRFDRIFEDNDWEKPEFTWRNDMSSDTAKRWFESSVTSVISLMCTLVSAPVESSHSSYYIALKHYVVASPMLVEYVFAHKSKTELTSFVPESTDVEFSGLDFPTHAGVLEQLIASETIPLGKSKLPAGSVKKFQATVPLKEFTAAPPSRSYLVLSMAARVFGDYTDGFCLNMPHLSAQDFLRRMNTELLTIDRPQLNLFFENILSSVPKSLVAGYGDLMFEISTSLQHALKIAGGRFGNKPFTAKSLLTQISLSLAKKKLSYLLPTSQRVRGCDMCNTEGNLIPMSDLKRLVHDNYIYGLLKCMAAMGSVNLTFSKKGEIVGISLTDLGKWILGLTTVYPKLEEPEAEGSVFEVNELTRIIYIKNPKSPLVGMLSDFAEKLTAERWVLTPKSFLKGCNTTSMLNAKIDRYISFIQPDAGEGIKQFFNSLKAKCDLVKQTPGGSTYVLYDIDPNDANLHALLRTDKKICENTLRVEGCRLLIKRNFLSTFLTLLRKEGYLTDIEV